MTHRTKAVRAGEKALTKKLAEALKAIGKEVAKMAASRYAKVAKAEEEDDRAHGIADAAVDGADWAPIADVSKTQLIAVAKDGASRALLALGITDEGITEQVFDEAVAWATARAAELVGKSWDDDGNLVDNPDADMAITDSLREEIRGEVADALSEGLPAAELADNIEDIGGFSAERAEMIARTEIIRSNGQGQLSAMRGSGVVDKKAWSTSEDGDTCDDCTDNADADAIDLDDDFPSGDDAPPAHPNCRCVLTSVIESDDDAASDEDDESEEDDDESTDEAAE